MNNDIEKWKGGNSGKPLCKRNKIRNFSYRIPVTILGTHVP